MTRQWPQIQVLAGLLVAAFPAPVHGQGVAVGEVVERSTAEPLGGVFVAVVDRSGRQAAAVLTDEAGRFRVRVPEHGTYTLRAGRIGFETVESPPLELGGSVVRYRFELDSQPIHLEGVVAAAEGRQCRVRPEDGDLLQSVWEQVRTALDVAAWTQRTDFVRAHQVVYERSLYPVSRRVRYERSRGRMAYGHVGFAAADPEQLIQRGFVQEDGEHYIFFGLDAGTITSDPFLDGHCFRLQPPPRGVDGVLGLAFEPVRGRTVPGVRGVLWLDEQTAELRSLEYSYTWLPWDIPSTPFGGETEFRRLPSGAWIVERWVIRMPEFEEVASRFERRPIPGGDRISRVPASQRLLIKEEGGEVRTIYGAGGSPLPGAQRAALRGAVHDSTSGRPLAGARIRIEGTEYEATTDEHGQYRISDLPTGVYGVTFDHPVLEEWDFEPVPEDVELERGQESVRDLAVPSVATILGRGCPAPSSEDVTSAAIVGRVLASSTGRPLGGARVTLRVPVHGSDDDTIETVSDAAGVYRFCGVPALGPALLAAGFASRGAEAGIHIPEAGSAYHELIVPLEVASRVVGRVVDAGTSEPIAGVAVRLSAGAGESITRADGRFTFTAVEPGPHAIAVRHVAYKTVEDSLIVDGSGRSLQVEIRMATDAIQLDPLVVTVEARTPSATLAAVYDRIDRVRLAGGGTVFDRHDIEHRNAARLTHLLGGVQGVTIQTVGGVPVLSSPRAATGWSACMMTVWVDGIMVLRGGAGGDGAMNIDQLVSISDVEAVELYQPGGRIPLEYWGSYSGCGVALIWTRRGT